LNKKYLVLIPIILSLFVPRIYPVDAQITPPITAQKQPVAPLSIPDSKTTLQALVKRLSEAAGVNPALTECLAAHESQWDATRVGDIGNKNGESYGLVQIEIQQHPDVTHAEALDPTFATEWMLKEIKAGRVNEWSTYLEYCLSIRIRFI
jgi:hypothetical protein